VEVEQAKAVQGVAKCIWPHLVQVAPGGGGDGVQHLQGQGATAACHISQAEAAAIIAAMLCLPTGTPKSN
jgi:hypothetical protein